MSCTMLMLTLMLTLVHHAHVLTLMLTPTLIWQVLLNERLRDAHSIMPLYSNVQSGVIFEPGHVTRTEP